MYGDMECAELTATLEGAVFEAAVTSQVPIEANIGSESQLDVGETISYVKSGIDEIEAAVSEKTAAFRRFRHCYRNTEIHRKSRRSA